MRNMIFAAALLAAAVPAASYGEDNSDAQLFTEINDTINNIEEETARESHGKCLEISKRIAARADMDALMRLYLESQIESCLAYAMNNGGFSDEGGDQCDHQFAHASKTAQLIKQTEGKEEFAGRLTEFTDSLERAVQLGKNMECKQDFKAFQG
jgi:DNA-binding FrmR family transcriptional regulator